MDEVKTKKSLGQHWLHDTEALQAIMDAADISGNDVVLEIGPGLGTLTTLLCDNAKQVIAVEFDQDLAENLANRVGKPNLKVEHADILDFEFTSLPPGYKVVANIPYYLTSHLIRKMCESSNPFSLASLLVQKEVAERVCAGPGKTSLISISTQYYCHVGLGPVVPAELFTPPPKIDSQVLMLSYRDRPLFEDIESKKFFRLVKAGFSERRKKLRSSLSGGLNISKQDADALLLTAGIDGNLRAQALTIMQWYGLYKAYEQ